MCHRRTWACVVLVAMLAAGCGAGGSAADLGALSAATPEPSGASNVTVEAGSDPAGLYVFGRDLLGGSTGPVRLGAKTSSLFAGWLSPMATVSADGRYLAYNAVRDELAIDADRSWSEQGIGAGRVLAVPHVRVRDLGTGADVVLQDGAHSIAWRHDGATAVFVGLERDYRAGVPYLGHIEVRPSLNAGAARWTTVAGSYVVAAWAGSTLLAYDVGEGEELELLALDAAGAVRTLGERTSLVALDETGTHAFVADQGDPIVRVLRVSDGSQVARLSLEEEDVPWAGYAGSWTGQRVVAHVASGAAVFSVAAGSIVLEKVVRLPSETYPHGLLEPRFDDQGAVVGWAWSGIGRHAASQLRCQLDSMSCVAGPERTDPFVRPVHNPSRPAR